MMFIEMTKNGRCIDCVLSTQYPVLGQCLGGTLETTTMLVLNELAVEMPVLPFPFGTERLGLPAFPQIFITLQRRNEVDLRLKISALPQ